MVVINIKETAKCSKGHHLIALYEIPKENFENLDIGGCFEKLNHEIENLETLTVIGKQFSIEYFVGNDMKMFYNEAGLKGATSNYPCPWCKCHRKDLWDLSVEWSIQDQDKGARTHERNSKTLLTKKIPISHYITDLLHMFFRIFEKLFDLFLGNIQVIDKILNLNENNFYTSNYKTLYKLERFIIEECKIKNFKFYIIKGELKYKSFNGEEMTKIKERINFQNIINNHQKVDSLKTIWDTFSKIMGKIKKNEISPETIKNQTSGWLKEFLSVYHKSNVTPYIHIFNTQLHEFVDCMVI